MTNSNKQPWIVWLRDDLRIVEHAAIRHAANNGSVLPVFILDDASPRRAPGAAARWWQRASLTALSDDVRSRGGQLLIRRGAAAQVLARLVDETKAAGVCMLSVYDQQGQAEQAAIKRVIAANADVAILPGDVLIEPGEILTKSDAPYRVFTPFWRELSQRLGRQQLAPQEPADIRWCSLQLSSETPAVIDVPDEQYGWTAGLEQAWQPGAASAHDLLQSFASDALATYEEDRNVPAVAGTSRLSPYLRFGEISIRELWDTVMALRFDSAIAPNQCECWLRELGWREFSRHLHFHYPQLATKNFRREYDDFDWRSDPEGLRAWQRGLTGYPLVDAGMRELWHTGWMHNRVRMVVASFLTKHLRIHWSEGEAWFWDTLIDADYANNTANWQWVAGTGADAAPYFRIFNPTMQAEKFDRDGEYMRRWLPELARLDNKSLRQPWLTDGVAGYPQPVVDHAAARKAALAANAALK